MSGMTMNLYLQADEVGTYKGRNANFNGEGFADQRFDVVAQSEKISKMGERNKSKLASYYTRHI